MEAKKLALLSSRVKRDERGSRWSRPGLATICTVALALLAGCGGAGSPRYAPSTPTVIAPPTRENIVEAVRRNVEAKTHDVTTHRQEPKVHTCSDYEVASDPYMPHNPELAKCPRVGATYTTWETVPERQTRRCEPLPGSEYGWHVQDVSHDKWLVSLGGSSWDVEKLSGAATSADKPINMSSFAFAITPHQDC